MRADEVRGSGHHPAMSASSLSRNSSACSLRGQLEYRERKARSPPASGDVTRGWTAGGDVTRVWAVSGDVTRVCTASRDVTRGGGRRGPHLRSAGRPPPPRPSPRTAHPPAPRRTAGTPGLGTPRARAWAVCGRMRDTTARGSRANSNFGCFRVCFECRLRFARARRARCTPRRPPSRGWRRRRRIARRRTSPSSPCRTARCRERPASSRALSSTRSAAVCEWAPHPPVNLAVGRTTAPERAGCHGPHAAPPPSNATGGSTLGCHFRRHAALRGSVEERVAQFA